MGYLSLLVRTPAAGAKSRRHTCLRLDKSTQYFAFTLPSLATACQYIYHLLSLRMQYGVLLFVYAMTGAICANPIRHGSIDVCPT